MEKFVPRKRNIAGEEVRNSLLEGNILRIDGREIGVEVVSRKYINEIPNSDNLFQKTGSLYCVGHYDKPIQKISISRDLFREAIESIRKEYDVVAVRCSGSGCCQYATYAYYIIGE